METAYDIIVLKFQGGGTAPLWPCRVQDTGKCMEPEEGGEGLVLDLQEGCKLGPTYLAISLS